MEWIQLIQDRTQLCAPACVKCTEFIEQVNNYSMNYFVTSVMMS